MYEIVTPGGKKYQPPTGRCWKNVESEYLKAKADNRMWFGKNGNNVPRRKTFLSESPGISPWTWWANSEVGHSQEAKHEVKDLLDNGERNFDTPKPTRLIQRILQIASDKDSIILDSFAGSGTTAHAVLNLNKKDNGNRRFILIEMMDYAETITAERVRRVIDGYGADNKAVPGTGGDFSYYTLGERIFDDEDNLNESIGIAKIRDYVARTEQLPGAEQGEHPAWLGEKDRMGYYFHYQPDQVTFLNMDFLATLTRKNEAYLIYADVCLLDSDFMHRHCIRFKKIPRDISRF
jgi:adenine-specific DNA-methyltransferase